MPEWVYFVAVFVALTAGYAAGFTFGFSRSDAAPSAAAWRAVREYGIDANKEIAKHEMDLNHKEQMALIERGAFDPVLEKVGYSEEEDDGDDD